MINIIRVKPENIDANANTEQTNTLILNKQSLANLKLYGLPCKEGIKYHWQFCLDNISGIDEKYVQVYFDNIDDAINHAVSSLTEKLEAIIRDLKKLDV